MKKYLGSKFTAFAAILSPLFCVGPTILGTIMLCSEISGPTIVLMLGGITCTFIWSWYIITVRTQLYSWGSFESTAVRITTLFSHPTILEYSKCNGCGIGCYTHGILNSNVGSKVYFIFLSYDTFEEKFRTKINLWKPSKTRIKVQFNYKLYDHLIKVLPSMQSKQLQNDYNRYVK